MAFLLRRIELGAADLAVLVGIGLGEALVSHLLLVRLEIAAVEEAVVVAVHPAETLRHFRLRRGFLAADAAIVVGVEFLHAAVHAATLVVRAAMAHLRAFVRGQATVMVLVELVELLREAKDIADDAKDNATSAMIDNWTDDAERRAWFLFEAARKG